VYLDLLIPACILSGLVAVVSFFLYVHYRMNFREKEEQRYRQIHFISLALFVLFGVLLLIELSHRYNLPQISY
jgi:threonine/homoserine/homoserine lactone efflux protein